MTLLCSTVPDFCAPNMAVDHTLGRPLPTPLLVLPLSALFTLFPFLLAFNGKFLEEDEEDDKGEKDEEDSTSAVLMSVSLFLLSHIERPKGELTMDATLYSASPALERVPLISSFVPFF